MFYCTNSDLVCLYDPDTICNESGSPRGHLHNRAYWNHNNIMFRIWRNRPTYSVYSRFRISMLGLYTARERQLPYVSYRADEMHRCVVFSDVGLNLISTIDTDIHTTQTL